MRIQMKKLAVLGVILVLLLTFTTPALAFNPQPEPPGKALANQLHAVANELGSVGNRLSSLLSRVQKQPDSRNVEGALGQLKAIAIQLDGMYARVGDVLDVISQRAPEVPPDPGINEAFEAVTIKAQAVIDLLRNAVIPPELRNAMNTVVDKASGIVLLAADAVEIDVLSISLSGSRVALKLPGGSIEALPLSGTTTNKVYFEGPLEGQAYDNDSDGRDEVQTELVALSLTGTSPSLGPVQVGLNPNITSTGEIEENANNTAGWLDVPPFRPSGTASTVHDIFFKLTVGGQTLYTIQPARFARVIDYKPPGPGAYFVFPQEIPLVDSNGNRTEYSLILVPRP